MKLNTIVLANAKLMVNVGKTYAGCFKGKVSLFNLNDLDFELIVLKTTTPVISDKIW